VTKSRSYTWEFLRHPYNQWLGVGFLGAGVLASFPFGLDAFVLTALAFVAVEIAGAAVIPSVPAFRASVDRNAARIEMEAARARLLAEIESHGGSQYVASYEGMCRRVESLYRVATDTSTALTEADVQQLERLTLDYLRLCLSDAVLSGREGGNPSSAVDQRLRSVVQRLERGGLDREEQQQLERARGEYVEVQKGQQRMASRRSAMEASLVAMPARMDEVYQMVMAAPASGELTQLLGESVKKLRIAEEVSMDVEAILGIGPIASVASGVSGAEVAARQRQVVGSRE
jgi:hypothetical protein